MLTWQRPILSRIPICHILSPHALCTNFIVTTPEFHRASNGCLWISSSHQSLFKMVLAHVNYRSHPLHVPATMNLHLIASCANSPSQTNLVHAYLHALFAAPCANWWPWSHAIYVCPHGVIIMHNLLSISASQCICVWLASYKDIINSHISCSVKIVTGATSHIPTFHSSWVASKSTSSSTLLNINAQEESII